MLYFFLGVLIASTILLIARNLAPPEKKVEGLLRSEKVVTSSQIRRELSVLLGPPFVGGNKIDILNNGKEIFPAMLEAIGAAKRTITFETFIYWSGDVGKRFSSAFAAKAKEGVEVKVLIDWLGSKIIGSEEEREMLDAGVDLQIYRPLNWYHLHKANHRTHRKILIVDGQMGFTGGVGIADQWKGDVRGADADHQWRDFHFRIQGQLVAHLQSVFINNWIKATGCLLRGEGYFPELDDAGEVEMQCFHSSPTEGAESVRLMFLYMIECARESLDISAAYFIPDPLMRQALLNANQQGVRIRVIIPGRNNDVRAVTHASREQWGELLEAGVEIHRFRPSMYHCKALIADRKIVTIGSANFDHRSFNLNDEMNVNVFNEGFARKLTDVFENDLQDCSQVTLAEWKSRPKLVKLRDWWHSLFESQL